MSSLLVDFCFVCSLVWTLYDASIVMRARGYAYWWLIPTTFAAPTFLILMLKLRYVRNIFSQRWQRDVIWNARVVLLPLYGALANTFLAASWMLCAPLYIVEQATLTATTTPFGIEEYTTIVREATLSVFAKPSSIAFYVAFVASVVTAAYLSARHRRVLIRFTIDAMEQGYDVRGNSSADTSLLTRRELDLKNVYQATTPQMPARYDTQSIDSLYATNDFVVERATFVPAGEATANAQHGGARFATVGDAEPVVTPRAPNAKSFDTMPKHIADEAKARRAETMTRYDSARQNGGAAQQPPTPRHNPPPPVSPPPPIQTSSTASANQSMGADDESETRLDSPRTIERIKRQRAGSRARTHKDE